MKPSAPPLLPKRKIRFFAILLLTGGILIGFLIAWGLKTLLENKNPSKQEAIQSALTETSSIILLRERENPLIGPLLLADVETESRDYTSLKGQLEQSINTFRQKGLITTASVYVKRLNDGSWMNINGDETYLPGSLMKVAIMLYFLKQEDLRPGTLDQEFYCMKPQREFPQQAIEGASIATGRSHKVSELLRYMIIESDNMATNVLSMHLNAKAFHQMFVDLGIPPDDINDLKYVINAREYSKFLRVLYNANYVNEKLSLYGLSLLTQSRYKDGLVKKLPSKTIVAHKFGERGINNNMDFSESGIIYNKSDPYLITIMTKGSNVKEQAEVISEISGEVYRALQQN
jgi:beta-lactamase class A